MGFRSLLAQAGGATLSLLLQQTGLGPGRGLLLQQTGLGPGRGLKL